MIWLCVALRGETMGLRPVAFDGGVGEVWVETRLVGAEVILMLICDDRWDAEMLHWCDGLWFEQRQARSTIRPTTPER